MKAYGAHDLEEFRSRLAELGVSLSPPTEPAHYFAYTDGACLGNPRGPGGWAALVYGEPGTRTWQLFGHLSSTSNNRAEALGVLGALEWVPAGSALEIHADSELTLRVLAGVYKARANTDIWEVIRTSIADKRLTVTGEWVRGHAGHELNEWADRLSKVGALNGQVEDLDVPPVPPVPAVPAVPAELADLQPRSDWEREFVTSVTDQLRRGRQLSAKQQAVIERMRAPKRSGS